MKEMSKAVILAKQTVAAVHFEKDLLSQMNHPFICNIIYAFQDSDNVYLILELSNGGDLRYHLYRHIKFNEQQTSMLIYIYLHIIYIEFIVACLVLALEYLHSIGVIHKDIKPENILFDTEGYVKLTDFGIARIMSSDNAKDASGTPGYMGK
jgi:serine/threonine kinase 32/serum/glucocorticoid-regulated kinase 2